MKVCIGVSSLKKVLELLLFYLKKHLNDEQNEKVNVVEKCIK